MADEIEEKAKQFMNVRVLVLSTILSALGFVLALFWNDAIRSSIESFLPPAQTVAAKFIVAIFVTIVIIILVYIMVQFNKISEKNIIQELRKVQDGQKEMVKRKLKAKKSINSAL